MQHRPSIHGSPGVYNHSPLAEPLLYTRTPSFHHHISSVLRDRRRILWVGRCTLFILEVGFDIARDVQNQGVQGSVLFGDVRGVKGKVLEHAGVEGEGGSSGR